MKIQVNAAKLFQWIEDDMRMQREVPLIYLKDQKWYQEFFEHNKKVFDEVTERRIGIANDHFEMDEKGMPKMTPKFREETVVVKEKTMLSKEVTEIKQVPDGETVVFKEGKTIDDYHKAMNDLMGAQYEVSTKAKVYSKFPIVANL